MSKNLIPHIDEIKELNPPKQSSKYSPHTWRLLNEKHKLFLKGFIENSITREDIISSYKDYYKGKTDFVQPFLLTMLWGFGTNGYGAYRTNGYLSEENIPLVQKALEDLKHGNVEMAYINLMKINGLSISYVSKVLYFGTRALGIKEYSLIFDIRVARALVRIEAGKEIENILNITPSDKYQDYVSYNKLIHKWAMDLNLDAEAVEMYLFDLKF